MSEGLSAGVAAVGLIVIGILTDAIGGGVPADMVPSSGTVTGAGAGALTVWVIRKLIHRLDRVIKLFEEAANRWSSHVQRTENIYKIAIKLHNEAGTPEHEVLDPTPVESQLIRRGPSR